MIGDVLTKKILIRIAMDLSNMVPFISLASEFLFCFSAQMPSSPPPHQKSSIKNSKEKVEYTNSCMLHNPPRDGGIEERFLLPLRHRKPVFQNSLTPHASMSDIPLWPTILKVVRIKFRIISMNEKRGKLGR